MRNIWRLGEERNELPSDIIPIKEPKWVNDVLTDKSYKYEGKPQAKIIKRKLMSVDEEVEDLLKE